ncbi:hypothetical protein PENTCL1PPCAC_14789, partial [Pristionchus entomophagus]
MLSIDILRDFEMGDDCGDVGREEFVGRRGQHHHEQNEEEDRRADDEPLHERMIVMVNEGRPGEVSASTA